MRVFLCDTSPAIQDSKRLCYLTLWMTTLMKITFVDTLDLMQAIERSSAAPGTKKEVY
jgi:hypothetical protein